MLVATKNQTLPSYISKKGNRTFVYDVTGPTEELKAYKKAQGTHYKTDEKTGAPLYFTTRPFIGGTGIIGISNDGNVFQDTSEQDEMRAIVEQGGGNWGNLLGEKLVGNYLDKILSGSTSAPKVENPEAKDVGSL